MTKLDNVLIYIKLKFRFSKIATTLHRTFQGSLIRHETLQYKAGGGGEEENVLFYEVENSISLKARVFSTGA